MNLTHKQAALLKVIIEGDGASPVDIDQILVRLPYETTKQSLQFSLRAMVAKGCIKKDGQVNRRGKSRVTYSPTPTGNALFNPGFIYGGSASAVGGPVSEIPASELGDLGEKDAELGDVFKGDPVGDLGIEI